MATEAHPALLIALLCCAIGFVATTASGQSAAINDTDTGAAVRELIGAKCLDCHNPESDSSKARRDFDGAWDLALVIDEWGDPLAVDLAPLWEVAQERSMPPRDSDFEKMSVSEAELLISWLEQGTPYPADGNRFVDLQMAAMYLSVDVEPKAQAAEPGFGRRLQIWLGRNHAATVHFPVALLLLAALMRLFRWGPWRERAWHAEGFCLAFGVGFGIVAAGLGWLNAANSGASSGLLERHRWVGVGVIVVATLLLLGRPAFGKGRIYGWLLIALALAVAIAGHQGGELVFGESYLDF